MSVEAILDYLHLWNMVANIQLNDQPDKIIWRWTPDGVYTAKSAYRMLHVGATPFLGHRLI